MGGISSSFESKDGVFSPQTRKRLESVNRHNRRINMEMTDKEMLKLQSRILKEYDYISNVYESMLVVDNLKKDCPIVYANDDFEKMSLYSKEEIIGRNCRFLQGKHTNKETVAKIRHAIREGKELEVEILNYRKDGTPFWNNFLLLPVHGRGKKVTHFIAIQKDVSVIKLGKTSPKQWSPPEIGIWLDHQGLSRFAEKFSDNNISGEEFLNITKDRLLELGIITTKDRNEIMNAVEYLKNHENNPYQDEMRESTPDYTFRPEEDGVNTQPNIQKPSNVTFWRKNARDSKMAVKCYHEDKIEIFLVSREITFEKLREEICNRFHCNMKIQWIDEDEDYVDISDDKDFGAALKVTNEGTLQLNLKKDSSKENFPHFDSLDYPALVARNGKIIYANEAAYKILEYEMSNQELSGILLDTLLEDPSDVTKNYTGYKEIKGKNEITKKGFLTITQSLGDTFITLIPKEKLEEQ